jgi:hypothetical protein
MLGLGGLTWLVGLAYTGDFWEGTCGWHGCASGLAGGDDCPYGSDVIETR